jgi:hypothetical protein
MDTQSSEQRPRRRLPYRRPRLVVYGNVVELTLSSQKQGPVPDAQWAIKGKSFLKSF